MLNRTTPEISADRGRLADPIMAPQFPVRVAEPSRGPVAKI